jgi:hypothetical protein
VVFKNLLQKIRDKESKVEKARRISILYLLVMFMVLSLPLSLYLLFLDICLEFFCALSEE